MRVELQAETKELFFWLNADIMLKPHGSLPNPKVLTLFLYSETGEFRQDVRTQEDVDLTVAGWLKEVLDGIR